MKTRTKIIIAAASAVAAIGITLGGWKIAYMDAKTPAEWCVERIKERDLFNESHLDKCAYHASKLGAYGDREAYFISIAYGGDRYGDWSETWFCLIGYRNPFFGTVRKGDVVSLSCTRTSRGRMI